jgi:cellulose biosynthesis protein BcsQ
MMLTPPDRRVITFYSYKGGVGRTMALANVAYRLAQQHGLKVIVVDWDLEAPGLHRFFGISREAAASSRGVLDYFAVWRDAVNRATQEPPSELRDITQWLIPIESGEYKPRQGSISVLIAGQQDGAYDQRLAGFQWQGFYAEAGGALAVERLREQLVGAADVVLIDSRTGLTDAAGICTIQIPDGVVLMTAPSEQALEGTEGIARSIAGASPADRAGRGSVRVWLSVGRFSSVEETDLAYRWFKDKSVWFEQGMRGGLWSAEDHAEGLRSHVIPHRGRWNFGEALLREREVDMRDPLMLAYGELTRTLARWLGAEAEPSLTPSISYTRIKILFLAANPTTTGRLQLAREFRSIEERVGMGKLRDVFALATRWNVRLGDLQRALLEENPHVLHFSGHTSGRGQIVLEDDAGDIALIDKGALADMIGILGGHLRLVVLNASDSEPVAEALVQHVDFAIGMDGPVTDDAAIVFAASFYQALGFGETVETAFQLACNDLRLRGTSEEQTPRLLTKAGLDAAQVVLASAPDS